MYVKKHEVANFPILKKPFVLISDKIYLFQILLDVTLVLNFAMEVVIRIAAMLVPGRKKQGVVELAVAFVSAPPFFYVKLLSLTWGSLVSDCKIAETGADGGRTDLDFLNFKVFNQVSWLRPPNT